MEILEKQLEVRGDDGRMTLGVQLAVRMKRGERTKSSAKLQIPQIERATLPAENRNRKGNQGRGQSRSRSRSRNESQNRSRSRSQTPYFYTEDPDVERMYMFGQLEIPSKHVFLRTFMSFAFVNVKPLLQGHVLVSPLRDASKLSELSRPEVADLFNVVALVCATLEQYYGVQSTTLTLKDGPDAGQTVPHLHVHVIPRRKGDIKNKELFARLFDQPRKKDFRDSEDMAREAASYRKLIYENAKRDALGRTPWPDHQSEDKADAAPSIEKKVEGFWKTNAPEGGGKDAQSDLKRRQEAGPISDDKVVLHIGPCRGEVKSTWYGKLFAATVCSGAAIAINSLVTKPPWANNW